MSYKLRKQFEVLTAYMNSLLSGESMDVKDCLNALDEIGELGTPYDAQHIVRHVFSENKLIAQKAVKMIRKLLTKKEVRAAWLNLYNSFVYLSDAERFNKNNLKTVG